MTKTGKQNSKISLRMYSLVIYSLSPIQAGIQAGHSWVEYGEHCKDKKLYNNWAKNHKTVMVMNGGSTITMQDHIDHLKAFGVDVVEFKEPDLGDLTAAASFIISDRIFDPTTNWYDLQQSGEEPPTGQEMALAKYVGKLHFHGGR